MRSWLILLAIGCVALPVAAGDMDAAAAAATEGIQEVVTRAYVEGIHKESDPEKIRAGFHPDFVMFVKTDDGIRQVTRDGWIARIEERKAKEPDAPRPEIGHEFTLVDATDDAAVARVEIHRDGEHVFTDYLSLYRFDDGWRIVGKIYQSHR